MNENENTAKYLVKRPNETEEFSFVATLEEIKAGLNSGQIKAEWSVKKESDGYWITVHELVHGQPHTKSTSACPAKRVVKAKLIITALAVFVLTCLFPPWLYSLNGPNGIHSRKPAGYYFIAKPPAPESSYPTYGVEIDPIRLAIEWAALAAVTGMVWVIVVKPPWSRDDKENRPQKFIPPPGNPKN